MPAVSPCADTTGWALGKNPFTPIMGVDIIETMRVIKRKVLEDFWELHPQAHEPLEHWFHMVKGEKWQHPAQVKLAFGSSVDFVANNRAIFDIKGNDYRLIAEINYRRQLVFIRFLGTHKEYEKVAATTVKRY